MRTSRDHERQKVARGPTFVNNDKPMKNNDPKDPSMMMKMKKNKHRIAAALQNNATMTTQETIPITLRNIRLDEKTWTGRTVLRRS